MEYSILQEITMQMKTTPSPFVPLTEGEAWKRHHTLPAQAMPLCGLREPNTVERYTGQQDLVHGTAKHSQEDPVSPWLPSSDSFCEGWCHQPERTQNHPEDGLLGHTQGVILIVLIDVKDPSTVGGIIP